MKKIVLTFFLGLTAICTNAQISVSSDTVFTSVPPGSPTSNYIFLLNLGNVNIPVQWSVSPSSVIAPGHSGVSVCFLPDGGCNAFSYNIFNNVLNVSGSANLFVTWAVDSTAVNGSTSYITINTDINGGKDLVYVFTAQTVLSTPELDEQAYKVYPLPASDVLNIEFPDNKTSRIELVNIQGAIVNSITINGDVRTEVNLNDLSTGLYFVNFYNAENMIIARKKVIKN
jgi:Secretion system C-terminal sorting domain